MLKLFIELDGDREKVLQAYAEADARGEVQRSRNAGNTPSREYAVRLWANGMNQGWLHAGGSARRHKLYEGSTLPSRSVEPERTYPTFEEGLRSMALSWKADPTRPTTTNEARAHWRNLIEEWCASEDLPLPIRKTGHRGILFKHPSGRSYVLSDNSPAHWAFMGCVSGATPTLSDVKDQMDRGVFPFCFARSRAERDLIESGEHASFGGFLGASHYGQVNRFPDGQAYKLCHLRPVGLKARGEVKDFSLDDLKSHVRRFLDPSNMLAVPLRYSGVGECAAFLDQFIEGD
jgi:hypothetical protein